MSARYGSVDRRPLAHQHLRDARTFAREKRSLHAVHALMMASELAVEQLAEQIGLAEKENCSSHRTRQLWARELHGLGQVSVDHHDLLRRLQRSWDDGRYRGREVRFSDRQLQSAVGTVASLLGEAFVEVAPEVAPATAAEPEPRAAMPRVTRAERIARERAQLTDAQIAEAARQETERRATERRIIQGNRAKLDAIAPSRVPESESDPARSTSAPDPSWPAPAPAPAVPQRGLRAAFAALPSWGQALVAVVVVLMSLPVVEVVVGVVFGVWGVLLMPLWLIVAGWLIFRKISGAISDQQIRSGEHLRYHDPHPFRDPHRPRRPGRRY